MGGLPTAGKPLSVTCGRIRGFGVDGAVQNQLWSAAELFRQKSLECDLKTDGRRRLGGTLVFSFSRRGRCLQNLSANSSSLLRQWT